jgi:opine dehydrogenase
MGFTFCRLVCKTSAAGVACGNSSAMSSSASSVLPAGKAATPNRRLIDAMWDPPGAGLEHPKTKPSVSATSCRGSPNTSETSSAPPVQPGFTSTTCSGDRWGAIDEAGGIRVTGKEEGFAPVSAASLDPAAVVPGAHLVVLVTQGQDQAAAASSIAPHLAPEQVVLVKPGCTGGALEVSEVLGDPRQLVAETDGFVFGCSSPAPGVSHIASIKRRFGVAALPAGRTDEALELIAELFPQATRAVDVLHTSLQNVNPILHLAPMVMNAGRIEHEGGSFDFYGDAVTPSVAAVMSAADGERMAVARALGVDVLPLRDWIGVTYGVEEADLYTAIQRLHRDVYGPSPAPTTLEHRYLLEDVPCGSVPVVSLGEQLGVGVDVTARCVHLASRLLGRDLWASGRTTARLGLANASADEIRARVRSG